MKEGLVLKGVITDSFNPQLIQPEDMHLNNLVRNRHNHTKSIKTLLIYHRLSTAET